jgi:hypothetical protein
MRKGKQKEKEIESEKKGKELTRSQPIRLAH